MASKIILKKSSVAAKAPVAADLEFGELALNYTDSKLYFKKADGTTIDAFTSSAASGTNLGVIAGTTSGPIVTSSTGTDVTLPSASNTASGVVTTGAQTFSGTKTFSSAVSNSFSIPTNTTPAVFTKDDNLTAWDYSGKSFSISGQESGPAGIFFKPDGLSMYVIGTTGDDVNQYSLSVAWDVSTAVFVQSSIKIGESTPAGIFFKPDGLVLYVTGSSGDAVREFSLSTAWNISTLTFVRSFSVSGQDTAPQDIWFKPDGTKMYLIGSTNDRIYEYNLSTAWDISTAVFLQFFSVSAEDSVPVAINFNDDGTKMYVLGATGADINRYSLSTPWDISTSVFFNNFYVGFQAISPTGLFINFDSGTAYVVGSSTDSVHQYNTLTDGIELVSSSGLFIDGSLYTNKNLFVTSGTRLDGTISVSGAATLASTLSVGSTATLGSTVTLSTTTGTIGIGTSQTSGTTTIGGTAQTGVLTIGRSTAAQTLDLAVGATTSATTKTINIGTNGVSGSITNINIGSQVSGSLGTTTINSALTTPLQITSTIATGTAPFVVTSTTRVANLNVATAGNADTATNVAYTGLTGTVPTWNQNTTGSAATLTTGRTIAITGDVSYTSGSFNGSANVTGTATLASVGTAGTYTKVTTDAKGRVTSGTTLAAADIPALDASKITSGTIDAARLPSYVDDVVEAANLAGFPATGETGKIYVALDTNKVYRWSGSAYIYITSGAVDSVAGKTGVVTLVKGDVGLGSVDNTADSAKNVLSATKLTTARTINGVSFDGTSNVTVADSTKQPLDADLTAIAALAGTTGLLRKTAANTWSLDTNAYVTSSGVTAVSGTAPIVSSGGTTPAISITAATTSAAGSMSAADKTKLDGIATGATANTGTVTSVGGTGGYGGLTLSGTVTTSGNLTLGGTPTGTWPISVSGSSASTTGNAATATTLATGRTIAMTGDVSYTSGSFNGSGNVTGTATLANSGVTAGTYTKVTVNAKGLATSGTTLAVSDIPELTMAKLPGAAYKQSVRCATTANLTATATTTTLTNSSTLAALVLDGITVATNDRVLVKNQTTAAQNGIYTVTNVGSASVAWVLTRTADADAADEIGAAVVNVDSGTTNGGELWTTTFKTTDTLGTTAMNWYEVLYNTGSWGISITGSSASTTGNAATATALQTARTIGGVSFNGTANINLPGVNTAGNQNTSGTAAISTAATATVSATASAFKVPFLNTTGVATGNFGLLHDSTATFTYNPSTNVLAVGTVSGALSGNASTATTLATARTINGTSFNGSANITTANWGTARTLSFTGDATGSASVNGSANVATALTLANTTVTAGSYTAANITVDSKGRITAASNGSAGGSYLPLTGGTLTGNLSGTTATFTGNLTVSSGNATGGGIVLADDGDIVDLNDGYCAMRFSQGVRIHGGNRTGTPNITLASNGTITAAGNVVANSDENLKKDWVELPSTFVEDLSKVKTGTYTRIDSGERQAGSSAQDWQKLLPEVVVKADNEQGTLSLAYGNAALVSAVELAKKVVSLEERLAKLEKLIQ